MLPKTNRLTPLLFLSLAFHMGLIVYLQRQKREVLPPIKPQKALVQTVYLKAEPPKKKEIVAAEKTPLPPTKITPNLSQPKPQKASDKALEPKKKEAKKAPLKKNPPVAKGKEKEDNPLKKAPPLSHTYVQEIAMQLKLLLSLPEYGEVTVSMQLLANGKIEKVEIIESQSTANEKYLLERLPKLTLPHPPHGQTLLKLTLSNA